jgi:FkbM family methyltransferase
MDIGTNIGYYSLLAASFGYSIISIEAMSDNVERYRESIALNHFEHLINIHHVGISNIPGGYLCMRMPEGNAGNGVATFSPTECRFSGHRAIKNIWKSQVAVRTLDEITTKHLYDNIIAIKLDIEGFETNALLGGKDFLKRVKPCYIWFEYTREAVQRSGRQPHDIFELLEELGYLVHDIATPEEIVHSSEDAFLEARHHLCPYVYQCGTLEKR